MFEIPHPLFLIKVYVAELIKVRGILFKKN